MAKGEVILDKQFLLHNMFNLIYKYFHIQLLSIVLLICFQLEICCLWERVKEEAYKCTFDCSTFELTGQSQQVQKDNGWLKFLEIFYDCDRQTS